MSGLFKLFAWLLIASCLCLEADAQSSRRGLLFNRNAAAAGGGTPAFVDGTNGVPATSATFIKMTNNVATGNSICIGVGWEDADRTWSCSDNQGNTYTAMSKTNQSSQPWGQMFRAINVTGASPLIITLTNNSASASAFIKCGMIEMSGVTALDAEAVAGIGTDNLPDTDNITTANAVEILVCFITNYEGQTCLPQTLWTESYEGSGFEMQYIVTAATGTFEGSGTLLGSANHTCFMAGFK